MVLGLKPPWVGASSTAGCGRGEARVSDKNRSAHTQHQKRVSHVGQMKALPHHRQGAHTPLESSIPGSFSKNVHRKETRRIPESKAGSVPVRRPIFDGLQRSSFREEAHATQEADQSAKKLEEDLTDLSAGRQNRQDHGNDSCSIELDLGLGFGPSFDGQRVRVPVHKSRLVDNPTPKDKRTQEDLCWQFSTAGLFWQSLSGLCVQSWKPRYATCRSSKASQARRARIRSELLPALKRSRLSESR